MQFTATPSTVVSLATAEGAKMPLIPHIPELIFGLVMIGILYWVVSNILTIGQQWWLYRKFGLNFSDTHPATT